MHHFDVNYLNDLTCFKVYNVIFTHVYVIFYFLWIKPEIIYKIPAQPATAEGYFHL